MSFTAAHESKDPRRDCQTCRDRKARLGFRGEVRADRDHVLCFECFRSERERQPAQRRAETTAPVHSPFDVAAALSSRQIAHRRAMLGHLSSSATRRPHGAATAAREESMQ
jgi:hypothetical protein